MLSIFRRRNETYIENEQLISWILADDSNPLCQIARFVTDGLVLDVGCGSGILGRLLIRNAGLVIDGVDPGVPPDHPGIRGYRNFYSFGIEDLINGPGISDYDWIILADVIEHFAYPDELLAMLARHAKPGAHFVISTPNVAHLSVRLGMVNGRFDYVSSGILESTHLRFFTLKTLESVLDAAGMSAERVVLLNRLPSLNQIAENGWLRGLISLFFIGNDRLALTYQFLVVARNKAAAFEPQALTQVGPVGLPALWNMLLHQAFAGLKRWLLRR